MKNHMGTDSMEDTSSPQQPDYTSDEKNVADVLDRNAPRESAWKAILVLYAWLKKSMHGEDEDTKKKAANAHAEQSVQTLDFITTYCEEALDKNDFTLIQNFMHMIIPDRTRHTSGSTSEPWNDLSFPAQPNLTINQAHDDFLERFKQKAIAVNNMALAVDCNLYHWEMNRHAGKDFSRQISFQMQRMYLLLEQNDCESVYYHCRDYLKLSQPLSLDTTRKAPHDEYLFIARRAMQQACGKKDYSLASKILFAFRFHPLERDDFDLVERCKRNVHDDEDILRCCQMLHKFYQTQRIVTDNGFMCRTKLYKEIRTIGDRAVLNRELHLAKWSFKLQADHLDQLIETFKEHDPGEAKKLKHEWDLVNVRRQAVTSHNSIHLETLTAKLERYRHTPHDNDPGDIDDDTYRDEIPWNIRPRDRDPDNSGSYTEPAKPPPRRPLRPAQAVSFAKPVCD